MKKCPCCYISCFYIKPQRTYVANNANKVATFLVSTSNRNFDAELFSNCSVATFLVSTSNRNYKIVQASKLLLLHFLFLHQTATIFWIVVGIV